MFKNYLKIALRNLWKHRAFSLINVSGLAIGMACCLLIVLFIQEEVRYDRHHEKAEAIYRVTMNLKLPGVEFNLASTMAPLGPALVTDLPEVTQAARLSRDNEYLVAWEDKRFYEESFYFADSTFLDVFTFPLVQGDPQAALATPFSVVITEEMARKYFGEGDPVGQVLRLDNGHDFTVTGILAPLPTASHLRFDFLASFESLMRMGRTDLESWDGVSAVHTYLVVPGAHGKAALEAKIDALHAQHAAEGNDEMITLGLQPLTEIHLQQGLVNNNADVGSRTNLYVFASIAFLILLIASINFINLSTARSAKRAREVGMRKVLGAVRGQLVRQFLGESVLLSVLALLLAVALVEVLLPLFNYLLDKNLVVHYATNGLLLLALGGITFFVGIVAGVYPAFVLSSFRPVEVLKGAAKRGFVAVLFRRGLVVLQFTIAIVLIIGSAVMAAQMTYFAEKDLGFNHEQIVVLELQDPDLHQTYETIKQALAQHAGVLQAAAASSTPGSNTYALASYRPEGAEDDEAVGIGTVFVDHDVVETWGLTLVAGRGFSRSFSTDTSEAVLLNEAAVKLLGWDDPVGKVLYDQETPKQVIGVVKDFHFSSLQTEIQPMTLQMSSDGYQYLAVRVSPQDITSTLAFLEQQWRTFAPAYPFEYTFVDEDFAGNYTATQRLSETIRAFTLLAIFVACLGLFGLVSFTTEQRTKEIGVRKVLGASVPGIWLLLSKDFLKLVAVAFVVAAPLAYFAMSRWLEDFAYRADLSWPIFVMAGLAALAIALLTVSYQSIKTALGNPVKSLRYE